MESNHYSLTFAKRETERDCGVIIKFQASQKGLYIETCNLREGIKETNRATICERETRLLLDYLKLSLGE
jgi:hypothetical protein